MFYFDFTRFIFPSLFDILFQNFLILISINNGSLEGRGTGIDHYLAGILFDKESTIKMCSPHLFNIMFCTSQIPSLAYGRTSGRVLMSEYKCGICTNKQLSWEKEFTLMKKYLEHLCKVGNIMFLSWMQVQTSDILISLLNALQTCKLSMKWLYTYS